MLFAQFICPFLVESVLGNRLGRLFPEVVSNLSMVLATVVPFHLSLEIERELSCEKRFLARSGSSLLQRVKNTH